MTHGWFVVKNRSTQDIADGVTIEERHRREKQFFATVAPWTGLKKSRVGIVALKVFLGQLLYTHISSEFPDVIKDIEEQSSATQKELELLGPSLQTPTEQRRFLARVAKLYQEVAANALSGDYDPEWEENSPLRLRMHIRKLNDDFDFRMRQSGHLKVFQTVDGKVDWKFRRFIGQRGEDDILQWIRAIYRDSRGTELPGTVRPAVLEFYFRRQSAPWENIAASYLKKVNSTVEAFNTALFSRLLKDDDIRANLRRRLSSSETLSSRKAHNQLAAILHDERGGILQTTNHYFADNLLKVRQERVAARLRAIVNEDNPLTDVSVLIAAVHLSNEDQAVNDIHDILKAYYKVALKRFNDNVVIQVVERHILGEGGPVKYLSQELIADLEDNELMDIVGEDFATASLRNDLTAKSERLQKALLIARQAAA